MTVLETDCYEPVSSAEVDPVLAKPFGLMLEALDDLQPGEVYVCTGASPRYALWGELMSTRAIRLGAAGTVVDGYSRDTNGILQLGFPTFSYGPYSQDQGPRGKVIDFRIAFKWGAFLFIPRISCLATLTGLHYPCKRGTRHIRTGARKGPR